MRLPEHMMVSVRRTSADRDDDRLSQARGGPTMRSARRGIGLADDGHAVTGGSASSLGGRCAGGGGGTAMTSTSILEMCTLGSHPGEKTGHRRRTVTGCARCCAANATFLAPDSAEVGWRKVVTIQRSARDRSADGKDGRSPPSRREIAIWRDVKSGDTDRDHRR